MSRDELIITLASRADDPTVHDLLGVVRDVVGLLAEIERDVLQKQGRVVVWRVGDVVKRSPLTLTIYPEITDPEASAREILTPALRGIALIEREPTIPAHFTPGAINRVRRLGRFLNNGVERIGLQTNDQAPVLLTEQTHSHIEQLAKRRPTHHYETATLRGRLEMVSVHGAFRFNIYNSLSGRKTACEFQPEQLGDVKAALERRVEASGRTKYDWLGRPVSMTVQRFRILKEASELPQFSDLERIDFTGGMDPTQHIRRIRDAE